MSLIPRKLAIITGSTRTPRIGPHVVNIIKTLLESSTLPNKPTLTVLDIADFKLPVYDEIVIPANVPAKEQFAFEHSKKWSAAVKPFDAYILLSPEYNSGPPGGLKNAIDYLYHEWIGKPVLIITYGLFGGLNASESLKTILTGMKLRVVPTRPALAFGGADFPEILAEMGPAGKDGVVGEKSREKWSTGEVRESVLKGYGELVELLEGSVVDGATVA
ncbi:Flavoprotein [Glarea lozoyensis ATCC 20868]|uniref:Flavoprotein n=2 Tax=Glarea lozoyensis TaxID=101852 RepID=S3DB23_GLAL2|nr:Flavoprotein [Glarea lozoyensis ATCC 20868]EHK99654.1 putative NAD(P)H-dependent FMN reductase LOT6 [Glarea lozoyensis 74030]EPE35677.1 Flavoprotein [Glarea lozoyensis ATCC 20868]